MDYKTLYEQSQKEVARMKCWARIHETNIDQCLSDVYQKDMEIERLTEEVKKLKENEEMEKLKKDNEEIRVLWGITKVKLQYYRHCGNEWYDDIGEFVKWMKEDGTDLPADAEDLMEHMKKNPLWKQWEKEEKEFQESVARTEAIACDPDAPFGHA